MMKGILPIKGPSHNQRRKERTMANSKAVRPVGLDHHSAKKPPKVLNLTVK
jgi:hypothetical protein